MKYNHIDFNGEWASTKTVEAFIDHEKHHGLTEQELRNIHALILIEQGVQPEVENTVDNGDNTSIQTEAISTEDARSSSGGNKGKRRKPADLEPGTDDGGKA